MMTIGIPIATGETIRLPLPESHFFAAVRGDGWQDWIEIEISRAQANEEFRRVFRLAKVGAYKRVILTASGEPVAEIRNPSLLLPGEDDFARDRNPAPRTYRISFPATGRTVYLADNKSWWQKRLREPKKYSQRERAFTKIWERENERKPGINHGHGLLQDLMLSTAEHEKPEGFQPWLSNRERKIVATFVQWLGTNCGQSFLHEVKRAGGITLL